MKVGTVSDLIHMKSIILGIIFGIINAAYAVSLSYDERLDLEAASSRFMAVQSASEPSGKQWKEFEDFLYNPAFSNTCVFSSLEEGFPKLPEIIFWLGESHDLLKTACNLKRLHFLSDTLKEAYENIFYSLEFHIESLSLEDTHRLWSCVSGCGYILPNEFLKRLNAYTAKKSSVFTSSLALSTLWHVSVLPQGRAFNCLATTLSTMKSLATSEDVHNFLFLRAYLTEVKLESVTTTHSMKSAIQTYQEHATYSVTTSNQQLELASFLQAFEPKFACEVFYKSLDTHFDIADKESKIVVDMDGLHHYKEDLFTSKRFRRPLDIMRDEILLSRGWKVYRIRVDEWADFKKTFATKMTKVSTLETFYKMYAVTS